MTHAFSGARRVPLQPWQTQPFYMGKVDVRRIEQALRPQAGVLDPLSGPALDALVSRFAFHHGVTVPELRGRIMTTRLTRLRQQMWSELRLTTRLSLTQIGRYFDRDHSTINQGIGFHAKRMAEGRG